MWNGSMDERPPSSGTQAEADLASRFLRRTSTTDQDQPPREAFGDTESRSQEEKGDDDSVDDDDLEFLRHLWAEAWPPVN